MTILNTRHQNAQIHKETTTDTKNSCDRINAQYSIEALAGVKCVIDELVSEYIIGDTYDL